MGETHNRFSTVQELLLQKRFGARPSVVGPRRGSGGEIAMRRG